MLRYMYKVNSRVESGPKQSPDMDLFFFHLWSVIAWDSNQDFTTTHRQETATIARLFSLGFA